MDAFHVLSLSITPVVLISACGLTTLALYNRLNAILARIRAFHQEKIDLLKIADKLDYDDQTILLEMLDSQITKVTVKAKTIQKSLYSLLSAISAFLVCSLLGAASVLHAWVGMLALGMHVFGAYACFWLEFAGQFAS